MMSIILTSPTTLETGGNRYPCVIGRGGLVAAKEKREGDGCTPRGIYALRACYFRPDRVPSPITQLPLIALSPNDGWCDDPAHTHYNRPVKRPFSASHEALWRSDHAYDLIIPLGYNDNPVEPGKGSAIFLHCLHDDGRPTAGCVAMRKEDILTLLPHLSEASTLQTGG